MAYRMDAAAPRIDYSDVIITKSQPGTRAYGAAGVKEDAERAALAGNQEARHG